MSMEQTKFEAPRDVLGPIPSLTVGIDEHKSIHQQRIPRKQSKRRQQRSANLHSPNVAEPRKFSPKTDGFKHFLYCMRRLAMASPERTVAWNEIRNIYRKETGRHLNTDELNLICGTSGLTKKQLICGVLSSFVEPVDSKCLILRFILSSAAATPSPVAGRSEEESGDISPVCAIAEASLADREAARQHIIEQLRLRGINIGDREAMIPEVTEQNVPSIAEEVEITQEADTETEAELKPVFKDSLEDLSSEVAVEIPEVAEKSEEINETQEPTVERLGAGMECIAGDEELGLDEKEVMSDVDVSLNMSNIDDAMEPQTPQRTEEIQVPTELEDSFVAEEKLNLDENQDVQGDCESKNEQTPVEKESAEVIVHQMEVCKPQEEISHVEHTIGTVSTQAVTEHVVEELLSKQPVEAVVVDEKSINSQNTTIEKVLEETQQDYTDTEDIPYDVTSNEQSRANSPIAEKPVVYTTTITVELEPKPQTATPSTACLDVTRNEEVAIERVEKEVVAAQPELTPIEAKKQEEATITPEVELEQRPMEIEQACSSDEKKNGKHVNIVAPRKPYGRCCNIL